MATSLYPPIDMIRDDLFGVPGEDSPGESVLESTDFTLDTDPLPAMMQELIRRRGASGEAHSAPRPLAVGQIRAITAVTDAHGEIVRPLGATCGFLLGAHLGEKRWTGWLVAQETDYASDQDLFIGEEDGPVDPVAAMIQAWNPVQIALHGNEVLFGTLSASRLAAVMLLAERGADGRIMPPRPGKFGAWQLEDSMVVVTGTPLGGHDDPRLAYQALYRRLAEELRAASQLAPEKAAASHGVGRWLVEACVRPGWPFGAMAASAVLAVTTLLLVATEFAPEVQTTSLTKSPSRVDQAKPQAGTEHVVFRVGLGETQTLTSLREIVSFPGASLMTLEFSNGKAVAWVALRRDAPLKADEFSAKVAGVAGVLSVERVSP